MADQKGSLQTSNSNNCIDALWSRKYSQMNLTWCILYSAVLHMYSLTKLRYVLVVRGLHTVHMGDTLESALKLSMNSYCTCTLYMTPLTHTCPLQRLSEYAQIWSNPAVGEPYEC